MGTAMTTKEQIDYHIEEASSELRRGNGLPPEPKYMEHAKVRSLLAIAILLREFLELAKTVDDPDNPPQAKSQPE